MFERPVRRQSGPLLFLPARFQRVAVLKWLKRVHAWTGFWGAALFLLLGTSGFLLNHRNVLKIETPKSVELSSVELPVAADAIGDADALAKWVQTRLALPVEGRAPPATDGKRDGRFMGKTVVEAEAWTRVFTLADTRLTARYIPGSTAVSVKRESLGLLATIKNLHKGVGLGIGWVLLIDTIAGALIAMSITGFLLWSRLHGPRLLAGAIAGGSLIWALAASVPLLG